MIKLTCKVAVFACFLILIMSCSPEKRLTRLVDANPQLLETKKVVFKDTIFLAPRKIIENNFALPLTSLDTVRIDNKDATVKIYKAGKNFKIEVETKPSVIYSSKEVNVSFVKKTSTKLKLDRWVSIPLTAFILLLIVVLVKFINPKNKQK